MFVWKTKINYKEAGVGPFKMLIRYDERQWDVDRKNVHDCFPLSFIYIFKLSDYGLAQVVFISTGIICLEQAKGGTLFIGKI